MPDVGITIVVGVPGGGKTLYAVEDIAFNPGRVVGNIKLLPTHPAYHRYEYLPSEFILSVLEEDKKGNPVKVRGFWEYPALQRDYTIYIDEADVYFDCTDHTLLKPINRFLKQHRKRNIRIVFIVQSVDNIYIRIRRLAQDVILCSKDSAGVTGWLPGFLQRFVRVRYPSYRMLAPTSWAFVREARAARIFSWYDTRDLI